MLDHGDIVAMTYLYDAFVVALECVVLIEQIINEANSQIVATVVKINRSPRSSNIMPK
ncbi:hypothetical protein [Pantoea sp. Mhis]|uniref:hypothetical protein n=1 Tax=Pantoea sp. Mhis TaxID=2576759 RepID=UPI001359752B|nr:hypothetical protein [Pantoea sp. Mhis]MXP56221.1 M20 family metallo-hydrolase [Pantoea sp. Mhis]